MVNPFKDAENLCKTIMRNGFDAYIVNAELQKAAMGPGERELDIATDAPLAELQKLFPDTEGYAFDGACARVRHGDTVFYFHPIDLCNEAIPMRFSPRRPFLWLFKGDLVKRRVERVLSAFQGRTASFGQILGEQGNGVAIHRGHSIAAGSS